MKRGYASLQTRAVDNEELGAFQGLVERQTP